MNNKLKIASVFLSSGIILSLSSQAFATTLEINSTYKGENVESYVRVIDSSGDPVRFVFTDKGYVQSRDGNEILSSNARNKSVFISEIVPGKYMLEGISLDKKYSIPYQEQINIVSEKNYQASLRLQDNVGSLTITAVDENNNPIKNAIFEIRGLSFSKNSQGYTVSDSGQNYVVTDSYGNISINNIPIGTYSIMQRSINGYSGFLNTNISIEYNKTSHATAINKKITENSQNNSGVSNTQGPSASTTTTNPLNTNSEKGLLKLNVKDGNFLKNVSYQLKLGTQIVKFKKNGNVYEDSTSGNITKIDTSSDSGVSILLTPNKYTISEVTTPSGYSKIKDREITIKKGIETKIDINKKKETTLSTINILNEKGTPIKNCLLEMHTKSGELMKFKYEGGVYTYDSSQSVTALDSANGEIRLKNIPVGEVLIKAIKLDTSYEKSEDVSYTMKKDESNIVNITLKKKKNVLTLVNNGEPIANVEYELYKDSDLVTKSKTQLDGNVQELTEDGDYYLSIISVPERYSKPSKKLKITLSNKVLDNSEISIESTNIKATTGRDIEGDEFTLFKDGKKYAVQKTDEHGNVMFSSLPYGKYSIKQTGKVKNSSMSNKEYNIIIDKDYQNGDSLDFTISTPIKSNSSSIRNIVLTVLAILICAVIYTVYNIRDICKKENISIKEALRKISKSLKEKIYFKRRPKENNLNNEKSKGNKKKLKFNMKNIFKKKEK